MEFIKLSFKNIPLKFQNRLRTLGLNENDEFEIVGQILKKDDCSYAIDPVFLKEMISYGRDIQE
jgi:hypothetical protein